MDGDIFKMSLDQRICDVSELLYSVVGNFISLMPSAILTDAAEEAMTDMFYALSGEVIMVVVRAVVVLARYVYSLVASPFAAIGDAVGEEVSALKIDWEAVQREIDLQLISDRHSFKFSEEVETELTFDFVKASTAHFVTTELILVMNYFINVLESIGNFWAPTTILTLADIWAF